MIDARIMNRLREMRESFQGEIMLDELDRMIYATDASVYQEQPVAVVCPSTEDDIQAVIHLANEIGVGLIPRAAGTSLAGQVVGSGIVVDVSKNLNQVLQIDKASRWVRVQPGVIRNELNMALAEHGLFFGPETSTSNRATIGGMLGNNSCGSNSIVYGTTRDQTISVSGFLSDGSRFEFTDMDSDALLRFREAPDDSFACQVIRETSNLLKDPDAQHRIRNEFPHPNVTRRNTGYAVDRLIESALLGGAQAGLNLSHLIAGSEGTLFFATEIKLRCHPLPPTESGLLCPHFESVEQALKATQVVMKHCKGGAGPVHACELIDRFILEGAARNIEQQKNLQFVEGKPEAILIVDLRSEDRTIIEATAMEIQTELKAAGLGYYLPLLFDDDIEKVWSLRKAGLGVVANVVGDAKPVTLIEDTAVAVEVLPEFIAEVNGLLESKYGAECVHYGHAGAGELHLRPIINLKTEQGVQTFRAIANDVAAIVKKFGGSLSGEHGDGRLRGEFLRSMIGEENYQLLKQIKQIWDPKNLLNPGKIIDAPSLTEQLRFAQNQSARTVETTFDFSETEGLQRAAEMCSGSGDCRKTELTGGVMCPSFMATRNEKDTTRARANVLRQVMTDPAVANPLADERVKEVMDLCLSCKGCKSECPSNVDVAKMKAEFLNQYYEVHGVPKRAKLIAGFARLSQRTSGVARIGNWFSSSSLTSGAVKKMMGFHPKRSLPKLQKTTLRKWFASHTPHQNADRDGAVILFCDEFTNYTDVEVGIATVQLLERLGYCVELLEHEESGRASISQGLLKQAKSYAQKNVSSLANCLNGNAKPVIGMEPSAALTLRDEYLTLVDPHLRSAAKTVAERTFLIDEFVSQLIAGGKVTADQFTDADKVIRLHGHCHQKALSSMKATIRMLQLPKNYQVKMIASGCCGMAGAFGYEKEHYDLSMQIGELVLFPAVRKEPTDSIIAAGGTSCRHQILDGTGRESLHPVQILNDAFGE